MGVALGYALAQTALVTFAIFTALALGLAAPYVALTLQPAWTRILPRPGAWMEVLKQAVSVPIFGTVIWLAWVVASAYGALMLTALLVSFLLLAIAGWFLGRWPAKRWSTALASLIGLGTVWLSIYGANNFADVRVPDHLLVVNLRKIAVWQPWSEDAVQKNLTAGRPVFVDFTASWCLSCQVNERVAFGSTRSQESLRRQQRRPSPRRLDPLRRLHHPDPDSLGRSGVPTYALYVPGEKSPRLLPEVLTPGIVTNALSQLPQ